MKSSHTPLKAENIANWTIAVSCLLSAPTQIMLKTKELKCKADLLKEQFQLHEQPLLLLIHLASYYYCTHRIVPQETRDFLSFRNVVCSVYGANGNGQMALLPSGYLRKRIFEKKEVILQTITGAHDFILIFPLICR